MHGSVEVTYKEGGIPYTWHSLLHTRETTSFAGDARVSVRFVVDNHPKVKTAEIRGIINEGSFMIPSVPHSVARKYAHGGYSEFLRGSTINGVATDGRVWTQMTFHGPNHEEVVAPFRIVDGVAVGRLRDLENGFWIEGVFGAKK